DGHVRAREVIGAVARLVVAVAERSGDLARGGGLRLRLGDGVGDEHQQHGGSYESGPHHVHHERRARRPPLSLARCEEDPNGGCEAVVSSGGAMRGGKPWMAGTAAAAAMLLWAGPAWAPAIFSSVVTADPTAPDGTAADGKCSLREAIDKINGNAAAD